MIEEYRVKNSLTAREVYNMFKKHNILEYIDETFDAIHTQDTNEIILEIEKQIKEKS